MPVFHPPSCTNFAWKGPVLKAGHCVSGSWAGVVGAGELVGVVRLVGLLTLFGLVASAWAGWVGVALL